ncbi:MAG: insulinase family protein, partial [Pseudomonadales bacterium]|nr:insulinase family protein [Pseudomonadales bacterium]
DAIIQATFAYIRLIQEKGIATWRFKEQQQLAQMDFNFKEKRAGIHEVTGLASQLQHYPTRDILLAPYLFEEYRPDLIRALLNKLTPKNMVLMLVAKGIQTEKVTPWFETPYKINPVTPEEINRWSHPPTDTTLSLPTPNPFIAQDLSIKPNLAENVLPQRITMGKGLTLWHLQDTGFKTPRADFYFTIRSVKANDTPAHRLLTEFYVRTVNDQLGEFSYPAYLAGLDYQLYRHVRGLSVRISGYQDKQPELLKAIIKTLKQPRLSEDKFAIFKNEMSRGLENSQKDQPYNQALGWISKLTLLSDWNEEQLKPVLDSLTLKDLKTFLVEFQQQIEVVALANGNLDAEEAKKMATLLQVEFIQSDNIQAVPHQPVIRLTQNTPFLYSFDVKHPDSAITTFIQGEDKTISTTARFALFNQVLSAPFYQALRTQQQRGYIVFATGMNLMDVPATALVIQSPNTSAVELGHHIDAFLTKFNTQVQKMTEEEFSKHQSALITRIMEKETRLSERSSRLWHEIDRENYEFNQREKLAQAVSTYSLGQFKQEYKSYLIGDSRRSLTVMANGERFPVQAEAINQYHPIKKRDDLPPAFF